MVMIRQRVVLVALVLWSSALAGCYLHRDPASLSMAVAVPELPQSLDPHVNDRPATAYVNSAIFDALTEIDEHGEVKPALATSWKPTGATTWEFKLRQDIRFQNGEEFNAATVVSNVRRV